MYIIFAIVFFCVVMYVVLDSDEKNSRERLDEVRKTRGDKFADYHESFPLPR